MLKRRVVNIITIVLLSVFVFFSAFFEISLWFIVLVLLIWFLITLCGSFFIQWNYHLTSLHVNTTIEANKVAITFDDGPDKEFTPKVLALLKKHNAKATFFCIGKNIEQHPEVLKKIVNEGHSIGNHTYSHSKSFGFFSIQKVVEELKNNNKIVKHLTGLELNLYRPAFGVTNPMIEKAVKKLDLKSIGWSIRSLDTTKLTEKTILKRIVPKISKGDIVLLHDTSQKTVNVLEQLLLFLDEKKMKCVTVDKLLQIDAYAT